ncbi:MAG: hypothetical protein KAQ88_01205 [Hyphomicrobiaceae bacterium]|nr:hypothetical protein [Hyphomicrobiaceae bacterium]
MPTIRRGAFGWIHELEVTYPAGHALAGQPFDVSASDLTNAIRLVPPSGTAKNATPTFTNTGADGLIRYTVPPGCFSKVGRWRVLFKVAIVGGLNGYTSAGTVDVQRIE